MEKTLLINYWDHPGFKFLSTKRNENNLQGLEVFKKIDDQFQSLIGESKVYSENQIEQVFSSEIQKNISELKILVADLMGESDAFKAVTLRSIDDLYQALKKETEFRNVGKTYKPRRGSDECSQMVNELSEKGFFIKKLNEGTLKEFWSEIAESREKLIEIKNSKRPREMASCVVPLPQEGKKWSLMRKMVNEAGIIDAVNEYSRFPMDFDYYALQLSHEYEQWWKNCYDDVGLPTSPAAYMHFDHDYCLIKGIIYLQPVTRDNSPFSVIPGSHTFIPSYARNVFLKALDQNLMGVSLSGPQVSSAYYRRPFKSQEYRSEFLKLPSVMIGTSHFGDDLLQNDDLTKWLLKKELQITSDLGNCTVFTGGRTIHRGGMVEKGERWVVQIGFRQRNMSFAGFQDRVKRRVKSALPETVVKAVRSAKSLRKRD